MTRVLPSTVGSKMFAGGTVSSELIGRSAGAMVGFIRRGVELSGSSPSLLVAVAIGVFIGASSLFVV